ncbi:hypothetical protein BH23CHL2_BH23CHL2_35740 [soil metagenome]
MIDQGHLLDELFGIVNVPSGVWIDEQGVIVRPPETAYPRRPGFLDRQPPPDATPRQIQAAEAVRNLRIDAETYIAALRDWVDRGPSSPYALPPDEVVERSRPRSRNHALAATHFELGQHLHRSGHPDDAAGHFREAHRLDPANWTYKRQAWSFVDPGQGPNDVYDGDWLSDVLEIGPENYYPELDIDPLSSESGEKRD